MSAPADEQSGYAIGRQVIVPRLGDIAQTGAAVIVNSIGSRASFRNPIAQAILAGAGQSVREEVLHHRPLAAGSIVITHAGNLPATSYLFHAIVTSAETKRKANPELIVRVTARCIQLADLLDQPTIALPLLGSGLGRAQPSVVIRQMLRAVLDRLPHCEALRTIVFATTSAERFALFNTRVLAALALAQRERELRAALPNLPVALLPLAAGLLQQLVAARQAASGGEGAADADDTALAQQAEALQRQAAGLISAGRELYAELERRPLERPDTAPHIVQLIIATGGSIIEHVSQQLHGAR
jgi:O-acetyl-ADP-ribose deacetylase (regulator of RNase III)